MGGIELSLSVAIIILAYAVKGALGFGEGLFSVSLMLVYLSPKEVLPIALLLAIVGGFYQFFYVRKHIDIPMIKTLAVPLVIGVAIGTWLLHILDARLVLIVFAIFLLFHSVRSILQIWREPTKNGKAARRPTSSFIGLFGGMVDGLIGVGGVPIIMHFNKLGFGKAVFRGTIVACFLILGVSRAVSYSYAGLITAQTLLVVLLLAPAAIAGLVAGMWLHRLIDETLFQKIVFGMLLLIGLVLLGRGILG